MLVTDCIYFNFYTSDFEGPLKDTCVLFMEVGDKYRMRNVISGRGEDAFIYFDPSWPSIEEEPEPCMASVDSYMADYNEDNYYLTIDEKVEVECE